MDNLKRERSVIRRHFSKQVNALEKLLECEIAPENTESEYEIEIKACSKLLRNEYVQLNELNKKIKQQILEKPDWAEKDLEEEIETAGRYENKFAILQTYLEQRELSRASSSSFSKTNEGENKRNVKLPILEVKKFDGNIKNWLNFWGSFKKIDSDNSISKIDKMQYLYQAMETDTEVQRFVNSFPLTNDSYTACIKDLKSRYARDDLLIQAYVRELLAIILDNSIEKELTSLYDKLNSSLRSLEILGVTKDKFSAFLLPMVESALPSDTLRAWERLRPSTSDDMLNCLLNFLKKEIESEQRVAMAKSNFTPECPKRYEPTATCLSVNVKDGRANESSTKCVWCDKANHQSLECYKIAKMSLDDRREHLKKKRACALCLKIGHHAKICKSFVKCYVCGQRHSPVMCTGISTPFDRKPSSTTAKPEKNKAEITLQNLSQNSLKTTTLLQTVAVKIRRGEKVATVRTLFDSGSQRSYIKKEVAEELGLPVAGNEELSHSLFGGVSVSFKKYNVYDFTIESLESTFKYNMSAIEQVCVCRNVPKVDESQEFLMRLLNKHNIKLSDSESSDIGLLIGADYSGALLTNLFIHLENGLTAIKTKIGWTLQGKINITNSNVVTSLFCALSISNFWDLELLGIKDPAQVQSKQQKEEEVMLNFEENIQINSEGRYEVHLPWKPGYDALRNNQQLAMRRLETTSRKLKSCGKFHDYDNVFSEWEQAGIIEEVPETERDESKVHYLAHRAVYKEASLTTKIRPVFDASAKDKNGLSLNLCLDKGINFLDRIPKLLIGFRKGCIGITADIAKAFLQISVTPQDRDYLRFLWWKNESCDDIKVYRHRRVVFGLTASPFLLSATISHHLNQVTDYKKTANSLAKSFYVDNLLTSLDSSQEAQTFIHEARSIMNEGKFDLRQWVTSPLQINETNMTVISVLGMMWNTATDELFCNISTMTPYTDIDKITKRNLLSLTQKIFDPIGFTCPVTLVPRLILQQIWNRDISWDQELPRDIITEFKNWYEHLECLNDCRLHRRLSAEPLENCNTSIHMFCDASKDGYSACVFLRSENKSNGNVAVRLVSAKSRITPPEKITIPRAELLSALIGSRLIKEARDDLELKDCDEFCWSDSGVALYWIKRELPWNTYVGNRVREIRQNTNTDNWYHIPGTENWADLASRGCNARQLLELRWWEGPPWLLQRQELWPRSELVVEEKVASNELRRKYNETTTSCNSNTVCRESFTQRLALYFSSYVQIVRMTAWILRFIYNVCHKNNKKTGEITCDEYDEAEKKILIIIQREEKQVIEKHCGKSIQIYYDDEDKLWKVRTKLLFSDFPECTKSPVIVTSKNIIIQRMVEQRHIELLHKGADTMITNLRKQYWIIGVRLLVKSVISKCIICKRYRSKATRAPTAPLPTERIKLTAPFQVTGVDLAGPLYLRDGEKCWIVLYTCAVYRAVHLELTQSLSTDAFLRTFRRFTARRGRVSVMISDNGSNFTSTRSLLNNINWNEVQQQSSIQRIKWKLNAPTAAWWGGFFERLIKILKGLLRRVLGTSVVTYEELETLICDCEAVINDRPLTYVQDDGGSSLEPLTPSCFLQVHPCDVTDIDLIDRTSLNLRLRYLQKLRDDFKQRFKNEYLTALVQNGTCQQDNIKIGDIVLIECEERRVKWPLGLVVKTFTGSDGIIRTVQVKTSTGFKTRPIQRLYKLELSSSEVEGQQKASTNEQIGKKFRIVINPSSTNRRPETSPEEPTVTKSTRTGRIIKLPARYNF